MTTAEGDYYVLEPPNLCHSNVHRSYQGLGLELVRHQVAPASHPLGNDLSSAEFALARLTSATLF
jgi:hypothetical protein